MRERICMSWFAVISLLLVLVPDLSAQTPTADEAAIKQLVQQVQDGWNAHDGAAFSAPFAADADYVIINGMKIKGREEIEKGHTAIFKTIYKDSRNNATVKGIRLLRADVAIVHIEWNLEYTAEGDKKKSRAMNSWVVTKDEGKWSIASFQITPIQGERP
jgi:uncharacterized protein (TIGR02246 family)